MMILHQIQQNMSNSPQKPANFVQNFRAGLVLMDSAPLPQSPKTAGNRRLSVDFGIFLMQSGQILQ